MQKKVSVIVVGLALVFLFSVSSSAILLDPFDWVVSTIKLKNIPNTGNLYVSCGSEPIAVPSTEEGSKDTMKFALIEDISQNPTKLMWEKPENLNYKEIANKVHKNLLRYRAEVVIECSSEEFCNYALSCSQKESTFSFEPKK